MCFAIGSQHFWCRGHASNPVSVIKKLNPMFSMIVFSGRFETREKARQSQIINQNGAISGFEMCFAPGTFGAGSQRCQPKHASKPDSVMKNFNPLSVYD